MAISHYGVIANVIQMATHYRLNDPSWPNKRMSPGDVVLAGILFCELIFSTLTVLVLPFFREHSLYRVCQQLNSFRHLWARRHCAFLLLFLLSY